MKRYDSYKDSGIEWIGEIPSHWEVKKIKYLVSINDDVLSEKTEENYEIEYVDISSIESNVGITKTETFAFKDAPSRARRLVNGGDIIVSTVRTYLKAIAKIEEAMSHVIVSTGFAVVRPRNILSNYTGHLFYHENLLGEIISRSVGVSYPAINSSEIGSIPVPLPPPSEQTAIAAYLDRKTAEIDELIADKKRLLELYEEEKNAIINELVTGKKVWNGHTWSEPVEVKDSGIEWLGATLEHWEVKRLKLLVSKIGSGVTPSGGSTVYLTSGIPLLRSQNIHFDGLRLDDVAYISKEIDEGMSNSRIQVGDVLLNITGASIGRCYYVPNEFGKGNVNQHVCIIRPNLEKVDTVFLYFILRSEIGQTQIRLQQTGSNREGLNFEQLRNFNLPVPKSTEEQQSIVHHIETECTRIDAKKAKTEKLIELLTEYRTALISEVVTGKVKVIP